jgi:hypothetical protein
MSISSLRRVLVTTALVLVGVALLVGLVLPSVQQIKWVGAKDLKITFRVLDADTNDPLKEAKVDVLDEDVCLCEEKHKPPFTLITGEDGTATDLVKQCMCFGTEGGWGPTRKDTFAIHIPGWNLQVRAPGYLSTEVVYLDTVENQHHVLRGDKTATLEVVVKLQKLGRAEGPAGRER